MARRRTRQCRPYASFAGMGSFRRSWDRRGRVRARAVGIVIIWLSSQGCSTPAGAPNHLKAADDVRGHVDFGGEDVDLADFDSVSVPDNPPISISIAFDNDTRSVGVVFDDWLEDGTVTSAEDVGAKLCSCSDSNFEQDESGAWVCVSRLGHRKQPQCSALSGDVTWTRGDDVCLDAEPASGRMCGSSWHLQLDAVTTEGEPIILDVDHGWHAVYIPGETPNSGRSRGCGFPMLMD
jgi:hypothetical protein